MAVVQSNWICPSCGNMNYPSRMVCNMRNCQAPKPFVPMPSAFAPQLHPQPIPMPFVPPLLPPLNWGLPPQDLNWALQAMRQQEAILQNTAMTLNALACVAPLLAMNNPSPPSKPGAKRLFSQVESPAGGNGKRIRSQQLDWICPSCGNQNFASRQACNMRSCGAPRPVAHRPAERSEPPMWKCDGCGNYNYPSRTHCNMKRCGLKKSDPTSLPASPTIKTEPTTEDIKPFPSEITTQLQPDLPEETQQEPNPVYDPMNDEGSSDFPVEPIIEAADVHDLDLNQNDDELMTDQIDHKDNDGGAPDHV